jgi:thiol:disulfide interchange protein DsbD
MKKIVAGLFLLAVTGLANAQMLTPVKWTYTVKKIDARNYEIHMAATIQPGWHMYSQTQPADAIVNPTEILFNSNPLISMDGKVKEVGKMELFKDKKLGISANQYTGQLEFVQKIKLKANIKTNISGSVEFQTCDDKKCLPPKKELFNLALK